MEIHQTLQIFRSPKKRILGRLLDSLLPLRRVIETARTQDEVLLLPRLLSIGLQEKETFEFWWLDILAFKEVL